MIWLVLAVLFFVAIFVVFKLFSRFQVNNFPAIVINYFVASLTGLIAFGGFSKLDAIISAPWLWVALLVGVLFVVVFYLFALCSQKLGVTITAMSSKISVVIPVFALMTIFGDRITGMKIAGMVLVVLSLYLMMKPDEARPLDKRYLVIPLLIFLGSGLSDTLFGFAKRFYTLGSTVDSALFVSTVFGISFFVGILVFPFTIKRGVAVVSKIDLVGGVILGLVNFLAVYFFTYAQGFFESGMFFPVFNIGVVSLSAMIGGLFFNERMSKTNYIGLFVSLFAILLMNL